MELLLYQDRFSKFTHTRYTILFQQYLHSCSQNSSLDLGGPLILGSGNVIRSFNYTTRGFTGFVGCIRNVMVNERVTDFSNPLLSANLSPGCDFTGTNCNADSCLNGGKCIGRWSSFICDCTPRFSGTTCEQSTFLQIIAL